MRNRAKIIGASLGLSLLIGSIAHAEDITTKYGETYHAYTLVRTEPDGILINYKPEGGGIGTAKVKFANLSETLQRQHNYDPQKAVVFEVSQARAQVALQAKLQADYKDATNRLAKRLAKEEEERQAEQAAAQAKLQTEQAAAQYKLLVEQATAREKLRLEALIVGSGSIPGGNWGSVNDAYVRTFKSEAQAQQIQQWSQAAAQGDAQAAANLAQSKSVFAQGLTAGVADYQWGQLKAGYVPNQYQPPGANGLYPNLPAQSGPLPISGNAAAPAGRK